MITVIGAISVKKAVSFAAPKAIATRTVNGGTNGSVFLAFIEQMLVPQMKK
ncbi:hypothetical protein IQ238_28495 [Pleurocapsales cyanobacterium LEGE 06147]|nr:hypothetical protein [Pleurocapsales cyanobacterium LEGE 06147]